VKLGPILKSYLGTDSTGQLVIKFAGEAYLCKVNIADGDATYISMGHKTPDETMEYIADKGIEGVDFIEDFCPSKECNGILNDRLLSLLQDRDIPANAANFNINVSEPVSSKKIDELIADFIEIVGPLGTVIINNSFSNLGYVKGNKMDGGDYSTLLYILLNEIPDEKKNEFKKRYS